jgi:hypothetical protein
MESMGASKPQAEHYRKSFSALSVASGVGTLRNICKY